MTSLRQMLDGGAPVCAPLVLNPLMAKLAEEAGFNAVVSGALGAEHLSLLNASAVLLSVPPVAAYNITAPEVVRVRVNSTLIFFDSEPANVPTFELLAAPGNVSAAVQSSRLAPQRASASRRSSTRTCARKSAMSRAEPMRSIATPLAPAGMAAPGRYALASATVDRTGPAGSGGAGGASPPQPMSRLCS